MSKTSSHPDLKTLAYVLHRTNYGEADRILNLITPAGKISAVARGVRKEKSKLAGNVEMFSRLEVAIHQGRRSELGVITSAKMLEFHSRLIANLDRLELAAKILKKISRAADSADSPEHFNLVAESLAALNNGAPAVVVEAWFLLRLLQVSGEEINLYRDTTGAKLESATRYFWHSTEMALAPQADGPIGATEIKLMRLMATSPLQVVLRVRQVELPAATILPIVRALATQSVV